MQYSLYCDQLKCSDRGISIDLGCLFDYITKSATWARGKEVEGEIFYNLHVGKICEDLPSISKVKRTMLKKIGKLEDAGLLQRKVIGNRPFYRITIKGKTRNKKEDKVCQKGHTRYVKNDTLGMSKMTHYPSTNNTSIIYNKENINFSSVSEENAHLTKTVEKLKKDLSDLKKKYKKYEDKDYSVDFQKFWKTFPHVRNGIKKDTYIFFNSMDKQQMHALKKEARILRMEIISGLDDHKYLKAAQNWIKGFTDLGELMYQKRMYDLYIYIDENFETDSDVYLKFKKQLSPKTLSKLRGMKRKESKTTFIKSLAQ